jgi:MerR family transcriptional regulator, heat shock protein HspR
MVTDRRGPDPTQGVYGISVAAALVGMAPQTLRLYEERGLLEPERTDGGTRRYSQDDLDQLHRIGQLLGEGLNLAGVAAVLELERVNARLRAENRRMRDGRRAQRAPTTPSESPPKARPSRPPWTAQSDRFAR